GAVAARSWLAVGFSRVVSVCIGVSTISFVQFEHLGCPPFEKSARHASARTGEAEQGGRHAAGAGMAHGQQVRLQCVDQTQYVVVGTHLACHLQTPLADACIGGTCTPRAGRRRAEKRLRTTPWRPLRNL
ncbi:MAG TPA: hypothetical protein VIZ86_08910, partial [Pseudomonas sp.]